jgi:hypothetical protein
MNVRCLNRFSGVGACCGPCFVDGMDALEEALKDMHRLDPNRLVLLAGIAPGRIVSTLLHKSDWFERDFGSKGRVFARVQDAVAFLQEKSSSHPPSGRNTPAVATPIGEYKSELQHAFKYQPHRKLSTDGELA